MLTFENGFLTTTEMESLMRILLFLCLSSLAASFKITSPLQIETKTLGLDFFNNLLSNGNDIQSNQPAKENQCFCFPRHSDSKLVTNHLDPKDQDIERLVVYLYRVNGIIQAFIPNKEKQAMIPDLTFDKEHGDVLQEVSLDPVADLFASSPTIIKPYDKNNYGSQILIDLPGKVEAEATGIEKFEMEADLTETETNLQHIVTEDLQLPNVIQPDLPVPIVTIPEPSVPLPENKPLVIPDISEIPTIEHLPSPEMAPNPTFESTQPMNDTKEPFLPQLENKPELLSVDNLPLPVQTPDEPYVGPISNIPLLSSQNIHLNIPNLTQIIDFLHDKPIEKEVKTIDDIINLPLYVTNNQSGDRYERLRQMLQILPPDATAYLKSLFPQLLFPYPGSSMEVHYLTFDDWFKDQLTRIFSQNLDISVFNDLRNKFLNILVNNGMYFSRNGMLYDSEGKLIKISNIKLRVILIGDPIEYKKMLNKDAIYKLITAARLPYRQIILITQVNPTRTLGYLPIGTVYLPRNLEGGPDLENFDWRSGLPLHNVGCKRKNCKFPIIKPFPLVPPRVPYYQVPVTSNFNKDVGVRHQLSKQFTELNGNPQPGRRFGLDNLDEASDIVQSLLKIIGTPNIVEQSRRLLGGKQFKGERPVPQVYPNDDQPGIRIIGGNPATSSGTPLVSKGRSGFAII